VGNIRVSVGALLVLVAGATPAQAQEETSRQEAYLGAVAEFFKLPRSEVEILSDWRLEVDDIAVVLFVARRAGVSPEALVALRRSGRGWSELTQRYRLDAAQFHVPLPDQADAGVLAGAYEKYRGLPVSRWPEVKLTDSEVVGLVNLRVVAQTLGVSPATVLQAAGGRHWHEVYARLIGDFDGPGRLEARR